jgi:hypothetical protein
MSAGWKFNDVQILSIIQHNQDFNKNDLFSVRDFFVATNDDPFQEEDISFDDLKILLKAYNHDFLRVMNHEGYILYDYYSEHEKRDKKGE